MYNLFRVLLPLSYVDIYNMLCILQASTYVDTIYNLLRISAGIVNKLL